MEHPSAVCDSVSVFFTAWRSKSAEYRKSAFRHTEAGKPDKLFAHNSLTPWMILRLKKTPEPAFLLLLGTDPDTAPTCFVIAGESHRKMQRLRITRLDGTRGSRRAVWTSITNPCPVQAFPSIRRASVG